MHKTYVPSLSIPAFGSLIEPVGVRLGWVPRSPYSGRLDSRSLSLSAPLELYGGISVVISLSPSCRPLSLLTSPLQSE